MNIMRQLELEHMKSSLPDFGADAMPRLRIPADVRASWAAAVSEYERRAERRKQAQTAGGIGVVAISGALAAGALGCSLQ